MSIRLDPRRVNALKHLAGEAGVRPGDLVRQWVEERIDGARAGAEGTSLESRVAALGERIAALEATIRGTLQDTEASAAETATPAPDGAAERPTDEPPRQVDPVRARRSKRVGAAPSERIALHDEMIALIRERGPMTAAELAAAITERGRYAPPRSGRPLDAAMVSQRVSNPTYRSRFVRADGRIGLAD
jgi:hypothetical protein